MGARDGAAIDEGDLGIDATYIPADNWHCDLAVCGAERGVHVIPVIDLQRGRAVHARGGDRAHYGPVLSAASDVAGDALALARGYRERLGLSELYVADLDAIAGARPQSALLRALAAESIAWIDGGAESEARAREVAATGAARVVIGLETLPALEAVVPIVRALGPSRVAVSLDLRAGLPPAGFASTPSVLVGSLITVGVQTVILLDLARVGSSRGPDLELLRLLHRDHPGAELVIAGGVRGVGDLRDAAAAGAWGALVATAFHAATIRRQDLKVLAHDSHA